MVYVPPFATAEAGSRNANAAPPGSGIPAAAGAVQGAPAAARTAAQPCARNAVRKPAAAASLPATAAALRPPRARRYDVSWLTREGGIAGTSRLAPALPVFEEAFSALAHGALVATDQGPVAIEDLSPGMRALTAEGEALRITWIGTIIHVPDAAAGGASEERGARDALIRVTADALGFGRPDSDLLLGPAAHILPAGATAYVRAASLIDGTGIFAARPAVPVTLRHLMLERHGTLKIGGLGIESFHPGASLDAIDDPRLAALFLSMFPQIKDRAALKPPAHPRRRAG